MTPYPRSGTRWAGISSHRLLATACVLLAQPALSPAARAQGLLPPVAADVNVGDLRREFERAYQTQPPASVPGYTVVPAIQVDGAWTDGLVGRNGQTVSDFYTGITPSLAMSADTRRLKGTLYLAPELRLFATQGNQNRLINNLNGSGELTVVEDLLYLDARAFATTQSFSGGRGPNGTTSLTQQDQADTQSYTINPLLRRRFGDLGTGQLGYSYTHTAIDGSGQVATPFSSAVGNQTTDTGTLQGSFATGEVLGRYSATLNVIYSDSTGTGTYSNSHRYSQIADLGYAVTRTVKLIGALGHEDIYYRGLTVYRNEGAVYTGGVQLTPDADTTISAQYGHRDGSTGFTFDGNYAATARTRLSLRYSEGIGSDAEDLQNTLASSTASVNGVPIDVRTGLPLSASNNFLGTQGNIYHTERLSASAVVLMDRNVVTLTVRRDDRTLVSQGTATSNLSAASHELGTYGSIAFQRELSDALNGTLFLQYGVRSAAGTTDQDSLTGSAGLSYTVSRTLSTNATYSYTSGASYGFSQQKAQNLFLVSVRKTF